MSGWFLWVWRFIKGERRRKNGGLRAGYLSEKEKKMGFWVVMVAG